MINEQALKDRIHIVAKNKNIRFNDCWRQLILERFLVRLAHSPHMDKFIFKGGFLLAYMVEIGRETVDLDFLLTRMKVEQREVQNLFEQIIAMHSLDGFAFSLDAIELLQQPHMEYPGYRMVLKTAFGKMKDQIQIDVGVGDVVKPESREIKLIHYRGKPFFESAISLLAYPVETIFSEKLETILAKGPGNSRMKDYHDLFLLIRNKRALNISKLKEAVANTLSNRGTPLSAIQFADLSSLQRLWAFHLRGLGDNAKTFDLPASISEVIDEINRYVAGINE